MTRVLLFGFVLAATACGGKTFPSLCANQVPPPAGCNTPCDPAPGAPNACTAGYHCSADGKCDTVCLQGGDQCGDGYKCTSDGHCIPDGSGSGTGDVDACPSTKFTAMKTTPTVELLLDQSGSMDEPYGSSPTRWAAMVNALVNPTNGIVMQLADRVVFGVTLYTGKSTDQSRTTIPPCPRLTTRPRALNNYPAISNLLNNSTWDDDTPTGESIDAVRMSFAANPPMAGSPPIIVLATDGLPDSCADANPPANEPAAQLATNAVAEAAAQRAYAAGIKLFFLFVGDAGQTGMHPQRMANAGAGLDLATGRARFYVATSPAQLTQAFNDIVGGVLSCDLRLSGQINPSEASTGTVTLDGRPLMYGTDWRVAQDGVTLQILGNACTMLKAATNPVVDAVFSCGAIIL